MKVNMTYDKESDAAYIKFGTGEPGSVAETVTYDDLPDEAKPGNVKGDVNLDFDKEGRLLGIEILYVSEILPRSFLAKL